MKNVPARSQPCACQICATSVEFAKGAKEFYELRDSCPALQLIIPDDLVEPHRASSTAEPDSAFHRSVPLLAYQRGWLPDFTASLHRFALDGECVRSNIRAQYLQDLRETWILEADELSRFKRCRNYLSRLAELDFARLLEADRWSIRNLEMYGGSFDVEAQDQTGSAAAFEIKFLGQREVLFELNRESFINPTVGWLGVYSPIDYLLFRLYEAAHQLRGAKTKRIAVAIVSDYDISYKIPLSEGWIDWANPAFLKRDSEIENFLKSEYAKNPGLDSEIKALIGQLNEIWILRYGERFQLHCEHRIQLS